MALTLTRMSQYYQVYRKRAQESSTQQALHPRCQHIQFHKMSTTNYCDDRLLSSVLLLQWKQT
jgi:hypothetical protein